jgi:transcriptional regulator with XRE-family HTH domain
MCVGGVVPRPASPTVRRRQLANVLRRLRRESGKTLEEAAAVLEVSGATLSRIETGMRVPRSRDVRDLLEAYDVTDEARVAEITALVAEARESGWWEAYSEVDDAYGTYIGLEAAATEIEQYEATVVPAMLQTPEYLRALQREVVNPQRERPLSEHDIEKRVEVLLERQRLLESPAGPKYSVVVDEGAFTRIVGGADVMRRQIDHVVETARLPNVRLCFLPFRSGAHPAQGGAFIIMSLPRDVSDVVYVDSFVAGQIFLEDAADLSRCRRIFAALISRSVDQPESQEALLDIAATFDAATQFGQAFTGEPE